MNRHIVCYNQMLWQQYAVSCPSFNVRVPGMYEFLDEEFLLRRVCVRPGDYIHLNDTVGIAKLAILIKDTIFNKRSNSGVRKSSPKVQHRQYKPP